MCKEEYVELFYFCAKSQLSYYVFLLLQGQAFHIQVTGDGFFECHLELFKVMTQEYLEAFKRSAVSERDQGSFRKGQMLDFLHPILRRIAHCISLPEDKDWVALRAFDLPPVDFLDVPSFMEKTEIRAKAMAKIDVEREKRKRSKPSDVIARSVMGEDSNPFIDSGRTYIRYAAKELIKHPTFESDILVRMPSFDYSLLFVLRHLQAIK